MSRPITLKKDGIQTRNRKLAAKSKKRRSGGLSAVGIMHDFFKPFDSSAMRFGAAAAYGGMGSANANAMANGYYGHASYYGQAFAPAQFVSPSSTSPASSAASMASMASPGFHGHSHFPSSMLAGGATA